MPAHSQTVTVPASYATAPNADLTFVPDTLVFRSEAGNYFFSFDGVNDHGRVVSTDPNLIISVQRRKVWFKQDGGAATARVSAYTIV